MGNAAKQLNADVFLKFPVLKSRRLLLRDIQIEDAEAIFEMRSNHRVNTFIPRPEMAELQAAQALITKTRTAFEAKQAIGWAGVLRGSGEIIGTCGFNTIEFQNLHAEIGGEMATAYWGKGIAQEAVEMILEFGFQTLGLNSIEAKVSPQNRGAIAILEGLGFEKEAHFKNRVCFKDAFLDMAVYTKFA